MQGFILSALFDVLPVCSGIELYNPVNMFNYVGILIYNINDTLFRNDTNVLLAVMALVLCLLLVTLP